MTQTDLSGVALVAAAQRSENLAGRDSGDARFRSWNDAVSSRLPHVPLSPRTRMVLANGVVIVALVQAVPTLIVLYRVYESRETAGIPLTAYFAQIGISLAWVTYALLARLSVLLIASSLLIIASVAVILAVVSARRDGASAATTGDTLVSPSSPPTGK